MNCIIIFDHLIASTSNAHGDFTPDPADYNAPMYKTGAHVGVLSTTGDL